MGLNRRKRIFPYLFICCFIFVLYLCLKIIIDLDKAEHDKRTLENDKRTLENDKRIENSFKNISPPSVPEHYLLENRELCSSTEIVDLFIMIESHPSHSDRRKAIRETWANITNVSSSITMKVLFLFGSVQNAALQNLLNDEFRQDKDILQGTFQDSYKNLSLTSIMGFHWINNRCSNAKIIIKADDDIVVNMYILLNYLESEHSFKTAQIACYHFERSLVVRNIDDKSYVEDNLFKDFKVYPKYCDGKFVMMTFDIIPSLIKLVAVTPHFWIEDVYLYGLVMNKLPNLKFKELYYGREIELNSEKAKLCLNHMNVFNCQTLIAGAYSGNDIRELWSMMPKHNKRISRYLYSYILVHQFHL